jgi:hypothetical protein
VLCKPDPSETVNIELVNRLKREKIELESQLAKSKTKERELSDLYNNVLKLNDEIKKEIIDELVKKLFPSILSDQGTTPSLEL